MQPGSTEDLDKYIVYRKTQEAEQILQQINKKKAQTVKEKDKTVTHSTIKYGFEKNT
jgi:hypothetical protein